MNPAHLTTSEIATCNCNSIGQTTRTRNGAMPRPRIAAQSCRRSFWSGPSVVCETSIWGSGFDAPLKIAHSIYGNALECRTDSKVKHGCDAGGSRFEVRSGVAGTFRKCESSFRLHLILLLPSDDSFHIVLRPLTSRYDSLCISSIQLTINMI